MSPERVARRIGRTLSKKRGQRGCVRGKVRERAKASREDTGGTSREDEKGLGGERCGVQGGGKDEAGGDSLERQ